MPPHIEYAYKDLRRALAQLFYLGPLRSPAKRFYLAQLENLPVVDPTGESLPIIIRERSHDLVWNCGFSPGSKPQQTSLEKALNVWCNYFRTGQYVESDFDSLEVSLDVTSDVLVEIRLKNPSGNESHALTDSGFGFSQVLPIVVRGLLANASTSLLVEQPELHLNPALQVRLANFFAAMVLAGKQVVLETHSEHIVNAIRVLCGEDSSGSLHSKCGIFYLAVQDGVPNIREMLIRRDGFVPNWPTEFFGSGHSRWSFASCSKTPSQKVVEHFMPAPLIPSPVLLDHSFPRNDAELQTVGIALGELQNRLQKGEFHVLITKTLQEFVSSFDWQRVDETGILRDIYRLLIQWSYKIMKHLSCSKR